MKRVQLKSQKKVEAFSTASITDAKSVLCTKAVLVSLNIKLWSARKFDKGVTKGVDETYGAKDSGRFNKHLMASKTLEEISVNAGSIRKAHYELTKPWMDEGPRVLPTALLVQHSAIVREGKDKHEELVNQFHQDYPALLLDAKERLNTLFKQEDYPPQSVIKQKFKFDVKLLPIPDAADFRVDVGNDQMAQIKSDLEERLADVYKDGIHDTKNRIVDVVSMMAEKLRGFNPDSKERAERGIFKASLVENIRSLVEILPAFNMSNDPKLTKIINRMAKELCAEEASDLRENELLRDSVAQSAESILADVEKFMM